VTIEAAGPDLVDSIGRPVHDLRVSVTDRCNLRCRYCMPREVFGPGFAFLAREQLLGFEEITRVVAAFARAGVTKVRLTGGEPLLRVDLPKLVEQLRDVPGIDDIALTTNGTLLRRHAAALKAAGLTRVTISLDSLDPETFATIADSGIELAAVLDGIEAAAEAGFGPMKLNTVVRRGWNSSDVVALASFARERGHTARFIEYMDVGDTNGWRLDDVVPADEIVTTIDARWPLEAMAPNYGGEVANRFRYRDGAGEVGVISSITKPFCGDCTRARLSAIGEVYTCLFAAAGHDLRALVRGGADDAALDRAVAAIWRPRADRYSELRSAYNGKHPGVLPLHKVEMSYIGG
jgi:cyclic pyranopterin phosphate synthase